MSETEYADLIVDGVRLADTDFSQFTRLCHFTTWKRKVKAAAGMSKDTDLDTLWKLGDYIDDLAGDTNDRLIDESRVREANCAPRNLDLVVVKTFPKEWTAEDREGNPDSCSIGKNDGRSPNQIVLEDFEDAAEMTNYEFAAYEILGDEECDRQGIDTLHDMFGTEFAVRFYSRKAQLIAKFDLEGLYQQRDELNAQIAAAEERAKG